MSLSARIVLRPSRTLAVCESLLAAGGLVVATGALVARWSAAGGVVAMLAIGCGVLSLLWIERRSPATVVVSDRLEVGLTTGDPRADDGASWQLAEGTMVWPGFSVVALTRDGRERRTLPVLDRDLDRRDRRALHRFLLWTVRGGAGSRPPDA